MRNNPNLTGLKGVRAATLSGLSDTSVLKIQVHEVTHKSTAMLMQGAFSFISLCMP